MSVDFPSSTEPAVARRSISAIRTLLPSEVAVLLAVFHAGLADAVVGAGGAPLGEAGGGDLGHDLLQRGGGRFDGPGARDVADGAEADGALLGLLAGQPRDERRVRHPH